MEYHGLTRAARLRARAWLIRSAWRSSTRRSGIAAACRRRFGGRAAAARGLAVFFALLVALALSMLRFTTCNCLPLASAPRAGLGARAAAGSAAFAMGRHALIVGCVAAPLAGPCFTSSQRATVLIGRRSTYRDGGRPERAAASGGISAQARCCRARVDGWVGLGACSACCSSRCACAGIALIPAWAQMLGWAALPYCQCDLSALMDGSADATGWQRLERRWLGMLVLVQRKMVGRPPVRGARRHAGRYKPWHCS